MFGEYFLNYVSSKLKKKEYYVHLREGDQEGPTITTWFMGVKPKSYINDFPIILKEQEYTDAMYRWGSETNGLENMVYHNLKSISNKVYYESNNNFIELSNQYLKHYDFSRVEYFTILPVKRTNNKFVIWFSVNNSTDSRIMDVFIDDVLLETFSPNESFRFAAKLKTSLSDDEIEDKVADLIKRLGLEGC